MAAGTQSGEVRLHFYSAPGSEDRIDEHDAPSVSVYEESGRACRAVSFNSANSDRMACGFDHKEGYPSLTIRDVSRNIDIKQLLGSYTTPRSIHSGSMGSVHGSSDRSQSQQQYNHSRAPSTSSSSIAVAGRDGEYGPAYSGSGVTSLSWVPGSSEDLLVASKKTRCSIRWCDMRDHNKSGTVLYVPMTGPDGAKNGTSGTVYDLQFDPFNNVRYMAHDRCGVVNMWDIRWATKPVHTFNTGQREILSMQFSPRRRGVIASLAADSGTFDIFTISEFFNDKVAPTERLNPKAFLDDARLKDQHGDDRMAGLSAPPPSGLRISTDKSKTVPLSMESTELHKAFLWIPPMVSSRTLCDKQLLSVTKHSPLHMTALPCPHVGVLNCRGDFAIGNNWSRLRSTRPTTDLEMDMLHIAVPEITELVLDASGRQSHTTQATAAGTKGGSFSLPATSAAVSTSASLSSVQQSNQLQSSAGSGLLARRQQAARLHAPDGDLRAGQLQERLKSMSVGPNGGSLASEMGVKVAPALLCEGMAAGSFSYNPAAEERNESSRILEEALSDDILVLMRHRALQGYGTSADKNVRTFQNDTKIRGMWQWIRDAHIRRHRGTFYVGYDMDASFYGIYDIMKLKRRELKYLYKQSPIEAQRRQQPAAACRTRLDGQRQLALSFCGWDLDGHIREKHIHALEAAGEFSAAAGASFIYGDHQRCLQSLENSMAQDQKLLSFMLKAQLDENNRLTPSRVTQPPSPPDEMFKCPHLQMIFMYLATGDWRQVIRNMDGLPMNYRVAVALRYLEDSSLMRYLLWAGRLAVRRGDLDGLLITGICGSGRLIMQTYVDNTADVQTAALASIFDPCSDAAAGETAEKWIYAYRHMLNKWRMFTTRCLFDIAHGNYRQAKGLLRVSEVGEKIAIPPADIRCTFCHQSVDHDPNRRKGRRMRGGGARGDGSGMSTPGVGAGSGTMLGVTATPTTPTKPVAAGIGAVHGGNKNSGSDQRMLHVGATAQPLIGQKSTSAGDARRKDPQQSQTRLLYTHCPKCNGKLPRCVVCRMKLGTPVVASGGDASEVLVGDFSQWFSWCQTCGHGGHVSHMQSWFATHSECPVPACECECDQKH
ncbi:hypothetical protein H4R20_001986 [Coemansia guatemalensis]|uniref:WD repeat protein mio zinc-ribbon like domain-containing protein n=1 Tax=Coemansia guatemalensis TaxID=2761395 RepID=A0A9W8HYH9_9FUNG|nr:hypothetical protein H4R20_001986 [Coemansia guatemalensis]